MSGESVDPRAVLLQRLHDVVRSAELTDLERSYEALLVAAAFVDSSLPVQVGYVSAPIHALINALSDTLRGGRPKLLAQQPARGRGPPKDQMYTVVQGTMAAGLDVLLRSGMSKQDALSFVAREATAHGILDQKAEKFLAKEIVRLRHRVGSDTAATATRAFQAQTAERISDQAAAKRRVQGMLLGLVGGGLGPTRILDKS